MTNAEGKRGGGGHSVALFVAYLKELPLGDWVEAARHRALTKEMSIAERELNSVVRKSEHPEQVFAAKQAVLDAIERFESAEGRRLTRARYATDHLRLATEHAALAVLFRQQLSPNQFETLYSPFEQVIPSALLFGLPRQ